MIDLNKQMDREGFVVGAPGIFEVADQGIESQFCASYTCGNCGHRGLTYRPFVERHTQTFRAFAECPDCGWADEL